MNDIIIRFAESDLSDAGRTLLNLVRGQNSHLAALLAPNADLVVYAELSGHPDSDDIVTVQVVDRLSWGERARRYGVQGLSPAAWRGRDERGMSELGEPDRDGDRFPIPSEKYIAAVEGFFEGETIPGRTRFEVPDAIVARVRRGELSGAAAWNALATEFEAWCESGGFIPWRNPDWITQTEAAELAGVALTTIRNAVRDGRLRAWTDPAENNSQRATRVSHADTLARRWGR